MPERNTRQRNEQPTVGGKLRRIAKVVALTGLLTVGTVGGVELVQKLGELHNNQAPQSQQQVSPFDSPLTDPFGR